MRMSSEEAMRGPTFDTALVPPPVHVWTERRILDALTTRFTATQRGAEIPRYVVAEHIGLSPTYPRRVLDLIRIDTWGSGGYALDGFEVKISRSDLRRELSDLTKAAAFEEHLDSFTIAAPAPVLAGWQELGMPDRWGVLAVSPEGRTRYLRKPESSAITENAWTAANTTTQPLPRPFVAALLRATVKTATRTKETP